MQPNTSPTVPATQNEEANEEDDASELENDALDERPRGTFPNHLLRL